MFFDVLTHLLMMLKSSCHGTMAYHFPTLQTFLISVSADIAKLFMGGSTGGSGQVRSGQVRSGQVRSGQVILFAKIGSGLVGSSQEKTTRNPVNKSLFVVGYFDTKFQRNRR